MGRPARHVLPLVLAVVAAVGLIGAPGSPAVTEVHAATPDLTVVSDAHYAVQPDKRRVRITLDVTLVNHLKDTKTRRHYFDRAYLAVQPGTSAYKASWSGSGTPSVRATKKTKDYTIIRLDLAKRLYGGQTAHYRVRFDIVDKGGKATRDIRIGDSLVSFPVWAYASDSTPGSSVDVTFPAGFQVDVEAGSIPAPKADAKGRTVFRSGRLERPLSFFAFLVGDRPGAYRERSIAPVVGDTTADIGIRSWPDDAAWDKRVGGLVERAVPVLGDAIGLPWPRQDRLVVQEAVSRSTGGYAGLFDPTEGLVEVAYYADAFVILHESAHSWFNGALLADRWANEAFASYYGLEAAAALKVKAVGDELTKAKEAARIPLNAWGAVGRETTETEDYAYAASLALGRAIAERAGDDSLRAVWAAGADRVGAYQPPVGSGSGAAAGSGTSSATGSPERVDGAPDWRGMLDLLEATTGSSFDDLWRTWVARPEDLPLLDARLAARARYDALVAKAGDWQLPKPIRDGMRHWQFEQATLLMDEAARVLDMRQSVEAAAGAAGLSVPDNLRLAFEGADGFADAFAEAEAELETIDRFEEATASRPSTDDPVVRLGLWDETPDAALDAASEAFAAGDLSGAAEASDAAAATWSGAAALGQGRAISLGALVFAVLMAVVLAVAWIRGRVRKRRSPPMQAHLVED